MTSEKTRWEVVANDIRQRIERGELTPGSQVPGEFDLADSHGVSRQTVRTALQRLQQEGLITEGKGRLGRKVRLRQPLWWNLTQFERGERRDDPENGADDWAAGVIEQGRTPRQEVSVSIEPAPTAVAKHLGIPAGTLAAKRHRVRLVDDEPYQLASSWFPEDLVRGTALMEPRDIAVPGGLMSAIGHPQVRIHDEIQVRMPTLGEAAELQLPSGTPVGQHTRVGYGKDGQPFRVMVTIFAGDRHYLIYDQDQADT
ncbi:MAG: GntR family transcriptional regulator [Carbonactinosporaceae bacterium]